jgi:hypothetical protein
VKTKRVVRTTVKRTVMEKVKKTGEPELSDREAEEERISKKKKKKRVVSFRIKKKKKKKSFFWKTEYY